MLNSIIMNKAKYQVTEVSNISFLEQSYNLQSFGIQRSSLKIQKDRPVGYPV